MAERKVDAISMGGTGAPPLVETNPPFLQNRNPAPAQLNVTLNSNIQFRITDAADDAHSGVDISSLVLRIQIGAGPITEIYNAFTGGWKNSYNGTITDAFLNNFSYDINIDPPGLFPGSTSITVFVAVRDKQTLVVNLLDTSYSFTTVVAETTPPVLSNQVPAPSSGPLGNLFTANILFRVSDTSIDPDSGVKIDTLTVEVKKGAAQPFQTAILNGVFQTGFSGTITPVGSPNFFGVYYLAYDIVIDPATNLLDADTTSVRVNVDDTKTTPNHLNTTYSFQVQQADQSPPFVDNQDPFPSQGNVLGDANIFFEIHDDETGVDQSTIDVVVTIDGSPSTAILGGVPQPGWEGSFFEFLPDGLSFGYTLVPDVEIGTSRTVTVQINAQDLGLTPNVMPTVTYQFFTSFLQPIAIVSQQRFDACLGSIIQLDARKSHTPDFSPITWEWTFAQVPLGSILAPDVGVTNPSSMMDLRPDLHSAVSFIPDKLGLYLINFVARNGGTQSETITIEVHVGLTRSYHGELHSPPDAHFLWDFISNFWNLVEDRAQIETIWSAMIQVIGAEYIKLWSNDYNKSLATIQNSVQRHWVEFDTKTDLIERLQRVILGNTDSASNGSTGNLVDPGAGSSKVFHVPLGVSSDPDYTDFTDLVANYGAKGRILDINGRGFTIERVFNSIDAPATLFKLQKLISGVYTDLTAAADSSSTNVAFLAGSGHYLVASMTGKFSGIRFVLASVASATLTPAFEYSTSLGWASLSPTDGTVGFTQSGDVTWDPSALVGWVARAENGVIGFHIRIQRTALLPTAPVEQTVQAVQSASVVIVDENDLVAGMVNMPWRLPHLLHIPLVDLEDAGVMAGDVLVFEVKRQDNGITADLRAQVVTVDRERVGFEFTLTSPLNPGDPTIDHALFRQLVLDLRIVHPTAQDDDIAAAAEALIAFIPTGINLSTRPFSEFQITFTAKEILHNTRIKISEDIVSIPHLQEELKAGPDFILQENWDYVLDNGFIRFTAGLWTPAEPVPDLLWAEMIHVDNADAIEKNFGRLVDLTKDTLVAKATRAPYLAAVRGLWYAYTRGPTVDAIRLGIQILMGLPFSDERGEIIVITPNYAIDSFGKPLGRMLIEDVDEQDRRTGIRKIYYYPMAVGLETNPKTGVGYAQGDIVERFVPLSKGVIVTDYVREPSWWVRSLNNLEVLKFFIFRAQIDVETDVFDYRDLHFALEFVRKIKPVYTEVIASALRSLSDDVMDAFDDNFVGIITLQFFDNVGHMGSLEATARADDDNQQGFTLWRLNSHPFSTRSAHLLRDVATTNGGTVVANSATGFGQVRARVVGDLTHPTIEGDILAIIQGQAGAGTHTPGLYEVTQVVSQNQIVLGNYVMPYDPTTLLLSVPPFATFPTGSGLVATVVRRDRNPVLCGTDLVTTGGTNQASSASASFLLNGVGIDDHLIIESGANAGEYRIAHTNTLTTPRNYTPAGTPQITATQVKLVNLDGTLPVLSALSGQDFRVIRVLMMRNRIENCQVVQSAGQMFVQCLDALDGSKPFDVFTPGLVGTTLRVANADNPVNNGLWTVAAYVHAGKLQVTGAVNTSDSAATAVVTLNSKYHPGYEKVEELAPLETFDATVA